MYVFLVIGYYKMYLSGNRIPKGIFLLTGVGLYIVYIAVLFFCERVDHPLAGMVNSLLSQFIDDYKSIPNAVCAFCIFIFFTKLKMKPNRGINFVASAAFAVYVIHQTPAFIDFLWFHIMKIQNWCGSPFLVPYFICTGLALYAVCMIIDSARKKWIEPLWVRSRSFQLVKRWIGGLYEGLPPISLKFPGTDIH